MAKPKVTPTFHDHEPTHESQGFDVIMGRLQVGVTVLFTPCPPYWRGMSDKEVEDSRRNWIPIEWRYDTQLVDEEEAVIRAAVEESECYQKLAKKGS